MPANGNAPVTMDAITWWRWVNARDLATFVDSHGRRPNSWLEFSRWISPDPPDPLEPTVVDADHEPSIGGTRTRD